jgi:hypothetical protein
MKTAKSGTNIFFGVSRIIDFRKMVKDKIGVDPEYHIRLIFVGKELEDQHTIGHYNIINHSTLHLVLR